MDENKKKELFPYFAYLYSKENKPAKYGSDITFDEWYSLIKEDAPFLEEITQAAVNLDEDKWSDLEKEYSEETLEETQSAKKGAKLNKLKKLRKMKKGGMKKCSCGCDLISVKESGGKISIKCSCGCKAK